MLRLFGACIGIRTVIRAAVTITYLRKLTVSDYVQIGDDTTLYTLGAIDIGSNSAVSPKSYLCAADHDFERPDFPLRERPIAVGEQLGEVAADVFIGAGVRIGNCLVIGARSSVFRNIPAGVIAVGPPCLAVGEGCCIRSSSSTTEQPQCVGVGADLSHVPADD